MLLANGGDGWMALELTSCVLPPGANGDVLNAMLLFRDGLFRPAGLQKIDDHTWVCQGAGSADQSIAYLRTSDEGPALLAQFRWVTPGGGRDLSHAGALVGHQPGHRIPRAFFDSRAVCRRRAQAHQVTTSPAAPINGERLVERWNWYEEHGNRVWLTVATYNVSADSLQAKIVTDGAPTLDGGELCEWTLARGGRSYELRITRAGAGAALSQKSTLRQGDIQTQVLQGNETLAQGKGQAGPMYIPGGLLPLVIGNLPFESMVLQTESIFGPHNSASPALLTLLLEPAFDAPRYEAGEDEPMRCWTVRINGSSAASRWYIDSQGRLQSISFGGGINAQCASRDE